LYTKKNDRQLIEVNRKIVDAQKETFLLNTTAALKQQQAEIDKLQKLVSTDAAIIDLRVQVKEAAKAQLENGVITANDYLREVNAEDQARQSLITHNIQLLQAQINYQTIAGKQ
jgi:outer membrane protein TolC